MKQAFSSNIAAYLSENHVVSITAAYRQEMWAANCFYAFEPETASLIVLTSTETHHGRLMLQNPHIVGTVSDQTESIVKLQGVQFSATAQLLNGEAARVALSRYIARHPIARLHQTDVWRIRLDKVKYSENKFVFGYKEQWIREEP